MIERQIVQTNMKELKIQEYITSVLKNLGQSHIKLQRTPLGEKIIIFASRPGLIVGRKGENIKRLTEDLKNRFKLENPQIEINDVDAPDLDAQIVAERIASSLEKFGTQRFKGIGHRVMIDSMNAGALGIEILITGKIPSSRAKRWRFYQGYLKKCGDIALTGVRYAFTAAHLKTGAVGIQVRIMPPETVLPDKIVLNDEITTVVEELTLESDKKEEADNKKASGSVKKETKKAAKKETKKSADKTNSKTEKSESDKKDSKKGSDSESKEPVQKKESSDISKPEADADLDNGSEKKDEEATVKKEPEKVETSSEEPVAEKTASADKKTVSESEGSDNKE